MRPRFRFVVVLAAFSVLGHAACSSFGGSADATPADEGGAPDGASGVDGSSPLDAPDDAAADAGVGLPLVNADFEPGCDGWRASNATLTDESAVTRQGTGACRVCRADAGAYAILQLVKTAILPGTYAFEAYVRAPSDAPAPMDLNAWTYLLSSDQGTALASHQSSGPALKTTEWKRIADLLPYDGDAGSWAEVVVGANSGDCFLIDDARLSRQ
jgi:hypothetical protein